MRLHSSGLVRCPGRLWTTFQNEGVMAGSANMALWTAEQVAVGRCSSALSMAAGGYDVVRGRQSMRRLGFSEVVFRPLVDFAEKVELAVALAQPSRLRASAPSSMQPSRSGGVERLTPPVVSMSRGVRLNRSSRRAQGRSPPASSRGAGTRNRGRQCAPLAPDHTASPSVRRSGTESSQTLCC
jgi:hypothetical protein